MGVHIARKALQEAALRFYVFRDEESASILDKAAEEFSGEKKHARSRREKWKERKENKVGDGMLICRVSGCRKPPEWRPVLSFPPEDGKTDRIIVETAMLDVCEHHARSLGPDAYTDNPTVWELICRVWTENGMEAPDPEGAELEYHKIRGNGVVR